MLKWLFLLILPFSLSAQGDLRMKILKEKEIHAYENEIVNLCLEVYREYPYLYDGIIEEYLPIVQHYAESPHGLACLLFDNDKPIGVAMGVPLKSFAELFSLPFLKQEEPPLEVAEWFYLGEAVLLKAYRGKGLGKQLLETFQKTVKEQNFEKMCFCQIEQEANSPYRPSDYYSLDKYLERQGFEKHPELYFMCTWNSVPTSEPADCKLVFWLNE